MVQSKDLPGEADRLQTSDLPAARIDLYARTEPTRVYAAVARTTNHEDGFFDVTYAEFAQAINRAAHWLDATLGEPENSRVFTFFGPSDLRVPILAVAAIKSGRFIQLCSPTMLSPKGRAAIFDTVDCRYILCADTPEAKSLSDGMLVERPNCQSLPAPELEEWLKPGDAPEYPYEKTIEQAIDEPAIGFHTSGTTGNPKPVTWTNRSLMVSDSWYKLPRDGTPYNIHAFDDRRVFSNFSFFHVGGMGNGLIIPIYNHTITIQASPYRSHTAQTMASAIRHSGATAANITPVFLEAMAADADSLDALSKLETIIYGGAPLNDATAHLLAARVPYLMSGFGSTEMGFLPSFYSHKAADHKYLAFHPLAGIVMEPQEEGEEGGSSANAGLHELVIKRQEPGADGRQYQNVWSLFPDRKEWRSKDLWRAHPSRPGFWRYEGRADDMISLSISSKLLVAGPEMAVAESPLVRSAVVGGHMRPRPFLIIELVDRDVVASVLGKNKEDNISVDDIWPAVEKANEVLEGPSRLTKELTIIAPRDRLFARTLKGSINRKNTIQLFEKEVDELYRAAGLEDGGGVSVLGPQANAE